MAVGTAVKGRLLLLHKYGSLSASFRHRLQQYVPYLQAAGFDCTVSPLLDDDYLEVRFRTGRRSLLAIFRGVARRFRILRRIRQFDLVFVFVELLPYAPWTLERILLGKRTPYIYDYDDPVFHSYDLSSRPWLRWLLAGKVREVARGAVAVLAGNRYLADYAEAVNPRVEVFPTVVDLARYPRRELSNRRRPFTIGWIGSPSTAPYLRLVEASVRRFCSTHQARLVLIGAGSTEKPNAWTEVRPWNEETEVADISSFDVGIMPLTDDPWSRGKSGFKLIQYMACGLPVLASPVGVNRDLVEPGLNGWLCVTEDDWHEGITRLYDQPELGARMGAAGRRRVETSYCLQVTAPRLVTLVGSILQAVPS